MNCNKCKKEIEWASFSAQVNTYGEVNLENGNYKIREQGDWNAEQYFCGECNANITKEVSEIL